MTIRSAPITIACVAFALSWNALGRTSQQLEDRSLDYVVRSGETLSGDMHVKSLTLPSGTLAYAQDDLRIDATTEILIAGTFVGLPGAHGSDADDIHMRAGERIIVSGWLHAAAGQHFDDGDERWNGMDGGRGSNVVLEAPVVWIAGMVAGGRGGSAGAGGKGGTGGTVVVVGGPLPAGEKVPALTLGVRSGGAGKGGHGVHDINDGKGGDGGDSGGVRYFETRDQVPDSLRDLID